jgi:cohesin domain-containing protein
MPSLKSAAFAVTLALAFASAPAMAVQDLTIGTATGLRGQTVTIPLSHTGDGSVVAFQVDVTYDPAVLGSPEVSTGPNLSGNLLRSAVVSSGRLRLVIYSPVNGPLGNGTLARLSFTIKTDAPTGTSALGLGSAVLGNATAVSVPSTHLGAGSVQVLAGVAPQVVSFGTVGDTGDGILVEKEITQVSITQLLVRFNAAVNDPTGNTQPGDVTNPASYLLVSAGPDAKLDTVSCAGVAAGDVAVAVDSVSYDSASTTAALSVGGGLALPKGIYRLLVCPSITSPAGVALDGNGDGTPGDAAPRSFEVGRTNLLRNPNFDKDLGSWILVSSKPAEIQRSATDRDGAATSGSAQVMNQTGTGQLYSLAQCVTLTGKGPYKVGGQARITSGRTSAPSVYAAIEYHAGSGCTGAVLGSTALTPALVGDTAGAWKPLSGSVASPDTAVSALVMFALDAGSSPDFTALLDALSFERAAIFQDGFESGDLSRWPGN